MILNVATFDPDQFAFSATAVRRGIRNQPDAVALTNLGRLWAEVLVPIAALTPRGLYLTSGYRSPLLNRTIGGAAGSQHQKGQAADIQAPGWTPEELFQAITDSGVTFDQLIQEFNEWVHVSWAPEPRGQRLRAIKCQGATSYRPA